MAYSSERIEAAKERMRAYAAYSALLAELEQHPMWKASDLADVLRRSNVLPNVTRERVSSWCSATLDTGERAFPGAIDYRGNIGYRIPTEDIIVFVAEGLVARLANVG